MYTLTHREPAFEGTDVQAVYERAVHWLNQQGNLFRYEYVADRPLIVLDAADTRRVGDVARESELAHWRQPDQTGTHAARRIDGGWEFGLIIYGD